VSQPDPPDPDAVDALGVPSNWWVRLGHDLRGPVGPMRMAVQVLRGGRGSPDEQRDALVLLDRQIDRLLGEIDDAADLVRARNGLPLVRARPGDLNLVIDPISGRVGLLRLLAEREQSLSCEPARCSNFCCARRQSTPASALS
jgi:signal transduction histidine kinase